MSLPVRILTKKFEALRSNVRSRTRSPSSSADFRLNASQSDHGAKLLEKGATDEKERISGPVFALPPEWVDIVDTIQKDLNRAKENIRTLVRLHNVRLKVTFGDEKIAEQERDIEILTQDITRLLRKSENNLKRIAMVGNDTGKLLSPQERTQRLNVMRAFAAELQLLSKQFRSAQKEFLKTLREQQQLGISFGGNNETSDLDGNASATLDEALDRGLSPEQAAQLKSLAERSDERYKEIVKIAQSVSDLASLFRELNVLVIEQGSLIDRIDYNMEQASVRVKAGTEELEKADEYSKKAYTFKCILVLLTILAILVVVLIVKKQ